MSRDLAVYAVRADPVAIDDLLTEVAARGTPAVWRSMFSRNDTARWSMGYLARGKPDPRSAVTISHEAVDALMRENALTSYGSTLTAELRAHLEQSRHVYRLSVPNSPDPRRDALLVNVIAAIGELADGVVVEPGSGRVEALPAFLQRTSPESRG
jgi:hypothetical protein